MSLVKFYSNELWWYNIWLFLRMAQTHHSRNKRRIGINFILGRLIYIFIILTEMKCSLSNVKGGLSNLSKICFLFSIDNLNNEEITCSALYK